MADEDVRKAVENLRKVMMENGMDEGTANALTSAAMPDTPSVVGNLADLQRLGALLVEHGASPTTALQEAFIPPPAPADASETGDSPLASSPDLGAMTKLQLQDYADTAGIDGVDMDSQTKAEMIAAIEGG